MKPTLFTIAVFLCFWANSLAYAQPRQFTVAELKQKLTSVQQAAESILDFVHSESALNAKSCGPTLNSLYQAVYRLPPSHFEGQPRVTEPAENETGTLRKFFLARVKLKERFRQFVLLDQFESEHEKQACALAVRRGIRTLRLWEEYWGLYSLMKQGLVNPFAEEDDENPKVGKYEDRWPYLMVSPDYKGKFNGPDSIQSGDILLSHGRRFTSSFISRFGAIDGQFSHVAIAYKHSDGKMYVLESIFETGLTMNTMKDYLSANKARMAVYRLYPFQGEGVSKPEEVSHAAAAHLAKIVQSGGACYNYLMRPYSDEQPCLYCSQAVAEALKAVCASEEFNCGSRSLDLPMFPSLLNAGNQLMSMIGVTEDKLYAPSDSEIDPFLDPVAEWRDFAAIEEAHRFDMTVTKILQWIEENGYYFGNDSVNAMLDFAASQGRELVTGLEKLPPETPEGFFKAAIIVYILMVHTGPGENPLHSFDLPKQYKKIVDRLVRNVGLTTYLRRVNQSWHKKTGFLLSELDMDIILEGVRRKDCIDFLDPDKPIVRFHDFFRPNFTGDNQCQIEKIGPWVSTW
jgi:hypothetical protein